MMRKLVLFYLLLSLSLQSCKKDVPEPTPTVQDAVLKLKTNNLFGEDPLLMNTPYTLSNGNRVRFSALAYYIGKLKLKSNSGDINLPEQYLLVRPDQSTYNLGNVKAGEYSGIAFDLGLDSLTNHSDPSLYPAGHPLGFQLQSMHWGWNTGYIFLMMEGQMDLSGTGNGEFDRNFLFHLGGNLLYRPDQIINKTIVLKAGETQTFNLNIDFSKVFQGVNLDQQNITMTFDNFQLARLLFDNFRLAIEPE
jgi:hypothetical protein